MKIHIKNVGFSTDGHYYLFLSYTFSQMPKMGGRQTTPQQNGQYWNHPVILVPFWEGQHFCLTFRRLLYLAMI